MPLTWKADELVSRRDACELLECSIGTLIKYLKELGISEVKTISDGYPGGKMYMYRYDDIQKVMDAMNTGYRRKTDRVAVMAIRDAEENPEDNWARKLKDIRAMLGIDELELQRVQLLNEILDLVIEAGKKAERLKGLL